MTKLTFHRRQLALAIMHDAYASNPDQSIERHETPDYHRAMAALYRARAARGSHAFDVPMREAA